MFKGDRGDIKKLKMLTKTKKLVSAFTLILPDESTVEDNGDAT